MTASIFQRVISRADVMFVTEVCAAGDSLPTHWGVPVADLESMCVQHHDGIDCRRTDRCGIQCGLSRRSREAEHSSDCFSRCRVASDEEVADQRNPLRKGRIVRRVLAKFGKEIAEDWIKAHDERLTEHISVSYPPIELIRLSKDRDQSRRSCAITSSRG